MSINLSFTRIEVNQFNLGSKRRNQCHSLPSNESLDWKDRPTAELQSDR